MNENLSIKLAILEREYPLNIPNNEEENLRNAGKRINDLAIKFRQKYPQADNQDLLSMVSLQFASKLIEAENSLKKNEVDEQLERMCEELDEFIKINQ